MSQRVLELVNDPALRARMGRAARQTVEAKFDLKMRVAQLVESYGVVSEPGPLERAASNQSAQIQHRATDARNSTAINPLLILEDKS